MITEKTLASSEAESYLPKQSIVISKIQDYVQFVKLRLTLLVVFSAVAGFSIATSGAIDWNKLVLLIIGGFLVTGSSNGFNQIIEKDLDKLMKRTANRPLPDNRMSVNEAFIAASLMGISGVSLLTFFLNPLSGMLGALALLLYTFVYTPLKRVTPFAVFVGAFPGAIPPLLGWVAVTNSIGIEALVLYCIQFIWQFPHFWAIAWVMDEDYKKAGFRMLPSSGGRNKASAFQTIVYAAGLIPIGLLPFYFHMAGIISAVIISICGILFTMQAINLYRTCSLKAAQQLMFGSFIYLPIVQIALIADKI